MLRAARVDRNQQEIIEAFRKLGCSVLPMHTLGKGAPDLAVGKCFKTVLVEIKDGSKVPSAQELTKHEQKFHENWRGAIYTVKDVSDVIALVKGMEHGIKDAYELTDTPLKGDYGTD